MKTMESDVKYGLDVVKVRLVHDNPIRPDRIIDCPQAAIDVLCDELSDYDREVFCVINIRADQSVINMNMVSMGTLTASHAGPREVFKSAILSNASAVILMHNHPSGNLVPSSSDYDVTKKLVDCGKLLDIPVMDHIIASGRERGKRYSFMEHGELGKTYKQIQAIRGESR